MKIRPGTVAASMLAPSAAARRYWLSVSSRFFRRGRLKIGAAEMRYNHRCWRVHWEHVRTAYAILRDDYASTEIDHNKMRYDAAVFFIMAGHLPEWMEGDTASGCVLVKVDDYPRGDWEALNLIRAFGNTAKHQTLWKRSSVFIDAVRVASDGSSATVVSQFGDAPREFKRDALELAAHAMDFWADRIAKNEYVKPERQRTR